MVLLVGAIDGNDLFLRQDLYNFCAELCRQPALSGCVIHYPVDHENRAWIRPFVYALRSAGLPRINLLIRTSSFAADDVDAAISMGIREIILLEDHPEIHFIENEKLGVRVWLSEIDKGGNNRKICGWRKFVPGLLSIEAVPFSISDGMGVILDEHAQEYLPGSWKQKLAVKEYGPYPLTEIPQWIFLPDQFHASPQREKKCFHDYIKGDLTKMNERKALSFKEDFFERVRRNAAKQIQ